jgi:peptidoglycan/xylan/chitin deacetylase (PgdA/CDA1 family)
MLTIKKIVCAGIAALIILPAIIITFSAKNKEEVTTLPIIMYHHISTVPKCWNNYTISPETFQGDLEYLRAQGYTTITIDQLVAYTRGEEQLPEKPIMITFDDGQASFAAYALPLLEEYHMSAVLAIIGTCADAYTKTEDHNIRYCYFSWPELAELNNSPSVDLAVHTYDMHSLNHRKGCKILKGENAEAYTLALTQDLEKVESCFEEYIGEKPIAFAYPYGLYCKEAKKILSERGYSVLFTCNERVNKLTGDPEELLSLSRFNRPNGMARDQFFKKLAS